MPVSKKCSTDPPRGNWVLFSFIAYIFHRLGKIFGIFSIPDDS